MNPWRLPAAAFFAATALLATAADERAPLALEQALETASRRLSERLLADTNGLPYVLVSPPRSEFATKRAAARMETMARFFDVILVDLDEAALSERMSTAFVASERLRARAPEATDTLRARVVYLDLLSRRNTARLNQRLTRSALALALGTPGRLADELVEPALPTGEEPPGETERPRAPSPSGTDPAANRLAHARVVARLEFEWLVRSERPRMRLRSALATRALDESRARFDAGESADLGNAMAATVEAQRDERGVDFAIALVLERIDALEGAGGSARPRR